MMVWLLALLHITAAIFDRGPHAVDVRCGNGKINANETCDDGNAVAGDGCDGTCLVEDLYHCPMPAQPCVAFGCGNGYKEGAEECDDGNAVAGDGCSASCTTEPGFLCFLAGAPCMVDRCSDSAMDCNGTCGGYAIVDDCNTCAGGFTERVPNDDKDHCGRCFGGNIDKDDCGLCFGDNQDLDVCGICRGDGTSCLGCDLVANSGAVLDTCGACSQANSSCLGCDGNLIPLGGWVRDGCGQCSGPPHLLDTSMSCVVGCDNVFESGVEVDCWGDCGGSAVLDPCGVCTLGATGRAYGALNDTDGENCFADHMPCASGTHDECGVCDGAGEACSGSPGCPAGVFDTCGVCGGSAGPGAACFRDCYGVLNGTARYDCKGVCNGTALLDDCGVCQTNIFLMNSNKDYCSDCFGRDAGKDSCGICGGNNTSMDQCGGCRAGEFQDSCGVCFGHDYDKDQCGDCFGNNACRGCDNIINSGRVRDACDVCGGTAQTPQEGGCEEEGSSITKSVVSPALAGGLAGGAFVILCCVGIINVIIYKRRKRNFVRDYQERREEELKDAPIGEVTLVFTDIQDSTIMWETFPNDMPTAIQMHHEICREIILDYNGYEVKTEGDAFMISFQNQVSAIQWAMTTQLRFYNTKWPAALMSFPACVEEAGRNGEPAFKGLRVRMGIHSGFPRYKPDPKTKIMDYYGAVVNRAARVEGCASGGQVLISDDVYQSAQAFLDDPQSKIVRKFLGLKSFKGVQGQMGVHQILPAYLAARTFPPVKSYVEELKKPVVTRPQSAGSSSGGSSGSGGGGKHQPIKKRLGAKQGSRKRLGQKTRSSSALNM